MGEVHPGPERLVAFLFEESGVYAQAPVRAHLAACPDCARRASQMREAAGEMRRFTATETDSGSSGVIRTLRRFVRRTPWGVIGLAASALLVGAAVLKLILLPTFMLKAAPQGASTGSDAGGAVTWKPFPATQNLSGRLATVIEVSGPVRWSPGDSLGAGRVQVPDGTLLLQLRDGSRLRLTKGARLELATGHGSRAGLRLSRGTAEIGAVALASPLVVETPGGDVEVLEGRVRVDVEREGGPNGASYRIRVEVTEGTVCFRDNLGNGRTVGAGHTIRANVPESAASGNPAYD